MATIANDPRFKLGRALLSGRGASSDDASGGADAALDVFGALLEGCIQSDGDGEASLNTALCQYEYGNALFRSVVRRTPLRNEEEEDKKPAAKSAAAEGRREVLAAAALKRSAPEGDANPSEEKRAKEGDIDISLPKGPAIQSNGGNVGTTSGLEEHAAKGDADGSDSGDDPDTVDLAEAKELLETSVVALSRIVNENGSDSEQQQFAKEQLPTVLMCIGDLLLYSAAEYGNAVEVYCQVLPYREEAWNSTKQTVDEDNVASMTVDGLRCQRLLAETNARIAEALLMCPAGEDVVCSNDDGDDGGSNEKKPAAGKVLVPARERIDFAESYYEEARLGLDDILMRAAASGVDLGEERKRLQEFVTLLVGVGNDLAREVGK